MIARTDFFNHAARLAGEQQAKLDAKKAQGIPEPAEQKYVTKKVKVVSRSAMVHGELY